MTGQNKCLEPDQISGNKTKEKILNERDELIAGLRKLKLPGVALNLEMRLKEANKNYVGYLNFLSLILQYEMISKESNNLKKRIRSAGFTRETTF